MLFDAQSQAEVIGPGGEGLKQVAVGDDSCRRQSAGQAQRPDQSGQVEAASRGTPPPGPPPARGRTASSSRAGRPRPAVGGGGRTGGRAGPGAPGWRSAAWDGPRIPYQPARSASEGDGAALAGASGWCKTLNIKTSELPYYNKCFRFRKIHSAVNRPVTRKNDGGVVPQQPRRPRRVQRHARAGRQVVQQLVGVGQRVEPAVRSPRRPAPGPAGSSAAAPSRPAAAAPGTRPAAAARSRPAALSQNGTRPPASASAAPRRSPGCPPAWPAAASAPRVSPARRPAAAAGAPPAP